MKITHGLEALLFVADSPATPEELAKALQVPLYEVEDALEKLGGRLHHTSSLQLVKIAGGYQLCTKPEYAEAVARFVRPQNSRLSRSLMEVLAVVAYKQPITQAELDDIRGVDSSYGLRQLVDRRLVCQIGRKAAPGRPVLFGTTQQFLHAFNLQSLEELPVVGFESTGLPSPVGQDQDPDQPSLLDQASDEVKSGTYLS